MELKDLEGKRVLTGVDFIEEDVPTFFDEDEYKNCSVCRFELDGVVYSAIEDPEDGYRSTMRELAVGGEIKNSIPAHEVVCRYVEKQTDYFDNMQECDMLHIVDTKTGKVVLEVGTDNINDYYPGYVARFQPENLSINSIGGSE